MTTSAVRTVRSESRRRQGPATQPTFASPENEAVFTAKFDELYQTTTLAQRQMANEIETMARKVGHAMLSGTTAKREEAVRLLREAKALIILLEGELE